MFRSRSESLGVLALTLAFAGGLPADLSARQSQAATMQKIVFSEFSVSRTEATMGLELENGRRMEFSIHDGSAWIDDEAVEDAARGSDLDRSWRELLSAAMEASGDDLMALLFNWDAPGESTLDAGLEAALQGVTGRAIGDADQADARADFNPDIDIDIGLDSVDRLVVRVRELQQLVDRLESEDGFPVTVDVVNRARGGGPSWFERGPLGNLFRGLGGIMRVAIFYSFVFAIAFATIYFGGRRYIEGVADTARTATTRSLLVGMAASFLVIPVFILGIIALAISIIGIPALLAWVPLFPVAVGLAILLGYIGVAHAAGETLAERRFYATDWFQRGNSYYFLLSGIGLLVAPFIAVNVIRMAGSWLGFLSGILLVIGVITTWAALSIGLGAVLLSRGGTRPGGNRPPLAPEPEIYAESTSA